MKFLAALVVTLLVGIALSAGLLLLAHGKGPLFLILATVGFFGLFVGYGCRAH